MAYGLSASADGNNFPWIFNPPATYWDGLSMIIKYIGEKEGGLDKLKGKTIGYIFFDGGYGREPIPLLEQFAKDYGFTVKQYPVPAAEMQNQSGLWLNVRRDRPDWMVMWGWGAMNPTAVKEATKINFPMDKFVGIWWSGGEDDARPAARRARAICRSTSTASARNYPAIQDIKKHVVDKGKSQTAKRQGRRELLQPRRLNSVIVAEAIRNAQQITGKKVVTGEDVRRGFETLKITAARWKEIGLRELRGADHQRVLRRPQRPSRGLHAAMGRHQVGEGLRLDHAHEGQGAPAAGGGVQGLRVQGTGLAEAHGALRQVELNSLSLSREAGRVAS